MLLLVLRFTQNPTKYKFDLPGNGMKNKLHCGCEWGVLWVWGSERMCVFEQTEGGPDPTLDRLTPLCPDPVLSCCLATLADPGAWVRSASPNDVDRTAIKLSKLPESVFRGRISAFVVSSLSKYSFKPQKQFSAQHIGDLSLKCCCDCRECSQKRNKHFENIWMHVLSFLWCLWWHVFLWYQSCCC